jgi:glutamine synthetase type III
MMLLLKCVNILIKRKESDCNPRLGAGYFLIDRALANSRPDLMMTEELC